MKTNSKTKEPLDPDQYNKARLAFKCGELLQKILDKADPELRQEFIKAHEALMIYDLPCESAAPGYQTAAPGC